MNGVILMYNKVGYVSRGVRMILILVRGGIRISSCFREYEYVLWIVVCMICFVL